MAHVDHHHRPRRAHRIGHLVTAALDQASLADRLAPPTRQLRSWWATTLRVARRDWKPTLLVTGTSLTGPATALEMARLAEAAAAPSGATAFILGTVLPAALLIIGSVVATIGWAGGVWALASQNDTGWPVTIRESYRYGLSRLRTLWPWTVTALIMLTAGLYAFVVPGVYLLFALSMFSYAVLIEHHRNPLLRSWKLTHTQLRRALTRWGAVAAIIVLFESALSLTFAVLSLALFGHAGIGSSGAGIQDRFIDAIHTAFGVPAGALLVIGLTVTYADLLITDKSH